MFQFLNPFFTAQTCSNLVGNEIPIPTFTSTTEPVKFMNQVYKSIVTGPVNSLYGANTAFKTQNDIALSAITATTPVQVLRLACTLTQLKLTAWDTNFAYGKNATDIYNYIITQRTNKALSDTTYLYYVKEFVIAVDNFGSAGGFP